MAIFFLFVLPPIQSARAREACCRYLGEYPRNKARIWTDNLQGVTHDDNFWYFTQTEQLWKIPVQQDLAMVEMPVVSRVKLADLALGEGCDHFGDPCALPGGLDGMTVVFVPVEGCPKPLLIALASDPVLADAPHLIAKTEMPQQDAPWCALDGQGRLFSSDSQISPQNPVYSYSIQMDHLRLGRPFLKQEADQVLNADPSGHPVFIQVPQGADFDQLGRLYIVSGYCCGRKAFGGGIRVFERQGPDDWTMVGRSQNGSGKFNYEYHPGTTCLQPFDLCLWEEPEGLTFWPLDDGRAPGISGSLHVLMIQHNSTLDGVRFKHYVVE